ncbi:FecR family protein [Methyloceanibacter caenitepidi]|uniref:FecR protein domain-containing protein n=1 Tax=Methyloceanibacter caenitepidi TaxID=1384459 RepID=A0A0A8K6K0_9HYPH|nr:FecR family protein [Methyloceanibacter caenitepidi]BAQ17634.1 hypothetical protein GL4_2191 [Methyloceanibacter caenitepidi]
MVKNGHLTLPRGAVAIALLCGAGVGFALSAPAKAAKVGVAAAVNPDAFSSLSQVPNKQLNIGKSIFYNERIETSAQGLVQVLLVDGSTFTVGPNSNLVIDKFVYDPNKKTGEMVATFSKGSMRFIGGKLSKNAGGVKVNTPDGALAIRGGMFQGNTQRRIYSFLYGHSMTMQGRNGQTQTVYQPGYTLDMSSGRGNVRPTTAEDTNVFMQALSSPNSNTAGTTGGDSGSQNPNSTAQQTGQQADNISNAASQAVGDATFAEIQTEIVKQLVRLEELRNDPVTLPKVIETPVINQPQTPTVVKTAATFDGFASGFVQTGENGSGKPEFLNNGTVVVMLDPKANTVTANVSADHNRTTEGPQIDAIAWLKENVQELRNVPDRYFPDITVGSETKTATAFNLGFLGSGNGAYTNNNIFQALGNPGTTQVSQFTSKTGTIDVGRFRVLWWKFGPYHYSVPISQRNDEYANVPHEGHLASLPGTLLCKDCSYLKFGTWASDVSFGQNAEDPTVEKMGGWWVASKDVVKTVGELPAQGNAFYAGNAVGTFAHRIEGKSWDQGLATGGVTLDWDFAERSGDLQVIDFGNDLGRKSFGGTVSSPVDVVGFSGDITNGGKGSMRGTFVGARPDLAPRAVMGDFNARGGNWRANGVYGARNVPNLPR